MTITVEQAVSQMIDRLVEMKALIANQDAEILRLREELNNVYKASQATETRELVGVDTVSEV